MTDNYEHLTLVVDPRMVDAAMLGIGLIIALATLWLQWWHFKKSHPVSKHPTEHEVSAHRRWRTRYWREVRASFFLSLVALGLCGFTVIFYKEVNLVSLVSIIFWLGMFFYNLWSAQWLAWRIATKRRR